MLLTANVLEFNKQKCRSLMKTFYPQTSPSLCFFLTYCVPHVVLSLFRVQQLRLVVLGFDGWPSPRT